MPDVKKTYRADDDRMASKTKRVAILLSFFVLLTLTSLLFLYYTLAIPLAETSINSPYTYEYQGTYNCTAALKPNTVYDNQTALELVEGSFYRRVINNINVSFTHVFTGDLEADFTVKYSVNEYLEIGDWKKQIVEFPQQTIEAAGYESDLTIENIPTINPTAIQQIANKFSEETGLFASQYSLNITTKVYIEAETSVGNVSEFLTPTVSLEFKSGAAEGEIISVSGLNYVKTGEIQQTETVYNQWVEQQRNWLYSLSTVSFFGLVASSWFFVKTKSQEPPKPEKILEDTIAPYEEIIVEAAQEPSQKEQTLRTANTMAVNTLEDLVKIADTLNKPIIHTYKPPETHIFRIIDGLTMYEFTTTATILEKRKEIAEEVEEEEEDE